MVHAFPFKEKSSFVKVVGKNELGKNMMHKCKWVHQNVKFHSGCVILVRFIYTNEIRHVTDLWLLLYLRTWFSYPPHPHRPPIAREYPLATASLSGSYAAVGADSAHSQKKKKKKITRRAATRFRSVLVYLRLVSLKIVPPLFFFNGSSVKLHRAVKEVRHRSGAENPTTFVRADVFYYALCETVQGRN